MNYHDNIIFDSLLIQDILEELEALVEIYNDLNFKLNDSRDELNVYFDAEVNLSNFVEVFIERHNESFQIHHFPPLSLNFTFSKKIPNLEVVVQTIWLTNDMIESLTNQILRIFKDNESDGALWKSLQFMESEILSHFFGNPSSSLKIDVHSLMEKDDVNNNLYDILKEFDKRKSKTVFNKSIVNCSACTINKRGVDCIELTKCQHSFCRDCATEYYRVQIELGLLELKCLMCDELVQYDEIKYVLEPKEFDRWDKLLLNQCLNRNNVSKPCPRCQIAVMIEGDDFGMCSQCNFVFCITCNKTYHGPQNCTEIERQRRLYEDRKFIQTALKCPSCHEGYEKDGGCNKMVCRTCGEYFCHLCHQILNRNMPYSHFGLAPKCFL